MGVCVMRTKEQNKNIDFGKVVSTDDIDMATDTIKGVCNLLNALEISHDSGTRNDDKNAFYALQVALDFGLNELEKLKPNIEYMDNFMRYETAGAK